MVSSPSSEQQPSVAKAADPLMALIEYGLTCIQRSQYAEGMISLQQAREQLPPGYAPLAATLETVNRAIANHVLAQQALHEASKRFAESDGEQQEQIAALQNLLPAFALTLPVPTETGKTQQKAARERQRLQLLRPANALAKAGGEKEMADGDGKLLPALRITCFGRFEVRRATFPEQPIELCRNLKGQAILRYLVAHPRHRETMDVLMTMLWPDDASEVAHHKLQVAISSLRRSLNGDLVVEAGGGYILCAGQSYQLNPRAELQTDSDEFLALYRAGMQASDEETVVMHFERACALYTGPFLSEDLYEDWSFIRREELCKAYVTMCDRLAGFALKTGDYKQAAKWAASILEINRCDEEAHCQLIRAYIAEGCRNEALRQYHYCQRVLAEELGVEPEMETQQLLATLMKR